MIITIAYLFHTSKILEKAKEHVMQCVTGEAVLRLNRTELSRQATKLRDIYITRQSHETLYEYYKDMISSEQESQFIQVSYFKLKIFDV